MGLNQTLVVYATVTTVGLHKKHKLLLEVVDLVSKCGNSSNVATLQHVCSIGYHTVYVIPSGVQIRNVRIAETVPTSTIYLGML